MEASPAAPIIRGNSLYTIVDGPSWTESEESAKKLGGNLIAITDNVENIFASQLVDQMSTDGYRGGLWIGLYSPNLDGEFEWSNGTVYNYSNWYPGQGLIEDYTPLIGNRRVVDGPYVHMLGQSSHEVGIGDGHYPGTWND